jgi:hypothetical protein
MQSRNQTLKKKKENKDKKINTLGSDNLNSASLLLHMFQNAE